MTAEIDPDGNTTAYAYDGAGDMTAMTQVLNGFTVTQTYSYNQAGQMVATVDEDNRTDSFTYDADGRLLNEVQYNSSGTATETIAYTYDQAGNMLTASNTEGGSTYAYSFQYNGAGQVTSVSEPFGASLSFGYDLAGNRTTVVDSINGSFTGTESLSYNADDKLTTLTYTDASDSLSINFSYNQADQMTQETMYSSGTLIATVSESYDGAGDAKTITYTESDGATLDSLSYAYDKAQELESESDSSGPTTNYTYNSLGELTAAGTQAYSFDAAGNPDSSGDTLESSAPSSGNELNTFVVPSDVPIIAGDTITYTYDNAGNVATAVDPTASTSWSYGYDNANNITSAALSVSGTLSESVNYTYDAFGNMIQEVVTTYGGSPGTTTQEFAMDGWNPAKAGALGNSGFDTWAVMNGSGQLQTRNIQGNGIDQILARIDNATYGATDNGLNFDLTDRLGSVRYVLSSTPDASPIASINYDAWGNVISAAAIDQGMYGWDGYDYDTATKLYFDNARVYDPVSQRWMSQDPMGDAAGDSNLFRYVNNAPTDATDPSGEAELFPYSLSSQFKAYVANPGLYVNTARGIVSGEIGYVKSHQTQAWIMKQRAILDISLQDREIEANQRIIRYQQGQIIYYTKGRMAGGPRANAEIQFAQSKIDQANKDNSRIETELAQNRSALEKYNAYLEYDYSLLEYLDKIKSQLPFGRVGPPQPPPFVPAKPILIDTPPSNPVHGGSATGVPNKPAGSSPTPTPPSAIRPVPTRPK